MRGEGLSAKDAASNDSGRDAGHVSNPWLGRTREHLLQHGCNVGQPGLQAFSVLAHVLEGLTLSDDSEEVSIGGSSPYTCL